MGKKRHEGKSLLEDTHPSLVKAVSVNMDQILNGAFLCIDPSSGSASNVKKGWTGSMPGYAVFRKGTLLRSGTIEVPEKLLKGPNYLLHRLQFIANALRRKFPKKFKLLVIEHIYFKPGRNTNMQSFQALNQSVGAIAAALQWRKVLGVIAWEWAKHKPEGYLKGDANDAISIGNFVINIAKELQASGVVTKSSSKSDEEDE